jgi:hypothetical protein
LNRFDLVLLGLERDAHIGNRVDSPRLPHSEDAFKAASLAPEALPPE